MSVTTITSRSHRRPLRTVLGVGALAAAALVGSLLPSTAAQASPAPSATGHAGTRAQIPWSKVGSGWTLATWSPSTNPETKAAGSLFLVGPSGARYLEASVSAGTEVVAFSPATQQALLENGNTGYLADVDLHTGYTHRISIPDLDDVLGYTYPAGVSLLVTVDQKQGVVQRLERYGAGGRHELTFPQRDASAGRIDAGDVQQTPDGRQVVAGAEHGLVVMRTGDGHVTRRLRAAGGKSCAAESWWSKGVVLAACGGQLYTVPISGATSVHRISLASAQDPFGYDGAWQTGARTPRLGLAENGCGPDSLVRFDRNGHGIRFTVPSPTGSRGVPSYVGHHRDVVTMTWNGFGGCQQGPTTLFAYDAQHNRSTAQLGPKVNGGTVTSAVPFPGDR